MTNKYEVGGKLRYVGDSDFHFSEGETYEIKYVDSTDIVVKSNHDCVRIMIHEYADKDFELVTEPTEEIPVEASPTVIELLANISRRLYEAEQTIKEQAYEINELYKAVADRG